jgi:hypothetical protein
MVARVALAPITKTFFADRIILAGGGSRRARECWGAETTDGIWDFFREESAGTPWLVYHRPSVSDGSCTTPVSLCGTLRACRAYVAAGHADADLKRLQAHDRGEHAEARDSYCGGCT